MESTKYLNNIFLYNPEDENNKEKIIKNYLIEMLQEMFKYYKYYYNKKKTIDLTFLNYFDNNNVNVD